MRRRALLALTAFIATCTVLAALAGSGPLPAPAPRAEPPRPASPRRLPGAQPGGSILLPNQWSLRPAGKQIELGDFPVNLALHPTGDWLAVLHAGYGTHEVVVLSLDPTRQ